MLSYLDSESIPYEIVYYETADAQKQALIDGDVDVISSVSLSPIANTRVVAQFAPWPYYFATTKGNTELIQTLDATIALIDQVDPNLQDTLYNNYFRVINDAFLLTARRRRTLPSWVRCMCCAQTAQAPAPAP